MISLENMRTIERHLQQCLNRIEDWATLLFQNSVRSFLSTTENTQ